MEAAAAERALMQQDRSQSETANKPFAVKVEYPISDSPCFPDPHGHFPQDAPPQDYSTTLKRTIAQHVDYHNQCPPPGRHLDCSYDFYFPFGNGYHHPLLPLQTTTFPPGLDLKEDYQSALQDFAVNASAPPTKYRRQSHGLPTTYSPPLHSLVWPKVDSPVAPYPGPPSEYVSATLNRDLWPPRLPSARVSPKADSPAVEAGSEVVSPLPGTPSACASPEEVDSLGVKAESPPYPSPLSPSISSERRWETNVEIVEQTQWILKSQCGNTITIGTRGLTVSAVRLEEDGHRLVLDLKEKW